MDFDALFSNNNDDAPKELSSDLRTSAVAIFNMYTAFMDSGFTAEQSLSLVSEVLRTMLS